MESIQAFVESIAPEQKPGAIWKVLQVVMKAFARPRVVDLFDRVETGAGKQVSDDWILDQIAKKKLKPDEYRYERASEDAELVLRFGEEGVVVTLNVRAPLLEQIEPWILQESIEIIREVASHTNTVASIGPCAGVAVSTEFPRIRPPKKHELFGPDSVVDFVSFDYVEREQPDVLDDLNRHPAPATVTEIAHGRLFQWVDSLSVGEEAIAQALMKRETWLSSLETSHIPPGWNDQGDVEFKAPGFVAHPNITMYNPRLGVGILPVVLNRSGSLPADELEQLSAWLSAGKLPDGSRLSKAALLLPSRKQAIDAKPQAQAAGIRLVLYPSPDKKLWDPFPRGNWRAPR